MKSRINWNAVVLLLLAMVSSGAAFASSHRERFILWGADPGAVHRLIHASGVQVDHYLKHQPAAVVWLSTPEMKRLQTRLPAGARIERDEIYKVTSSAIHGHPLSFENGQVGHLSSGQVEDASEGELVNGQLAQVVNGKLKPMVNGQLQALVNGQLQALVNGQLQALVNGQLQALVNGQLQAMVNGQLVAMVNGQPQSITSGQLHAIVNGQLVAMVNGKTVPVLTGSFFHVVKGHLLPLKGTKAVRMVDGQLMVKNRPVYYYSQPAQSIPSGITTVKAPQAWAKSRGEGVLVCVVDTGVQRDHPDLAANIAGGENFVKIGGHVDANEFDDDNGHGTNVAGIIAAIDNGIGVVGVAPEAKIFAVKVMNRKGEGNVSDIADGIGSCVRHHAQVINLSFGSDSGNGAIKNAISQAALAGISVVASAGNESGPVGFPATLPGVIAVSAVDSNLNGLASFSDHGPKIDYTAPGTVVYSTYLFGLYAAFSGTSQAAPHVAGAEALRIAAKARALKAKNIGLKPSEQGKGLIDAFATVGGS